MKKQNLSATVKKLYLRGGIYDLLRRLFPNSEAAILRYHAIVEPENNFYTSPSIALSPSAFEIHVKYLSSKYYVLSLDQIIDRLHQGKPFPRNSIAFTFDDGYADNLLAAQTLHKYGGNGTFYVTVDPIDRKSRLWLAEVTCLVLKTDKKVFRISADKRHLEFTISDVESRWRAIREIIRIIKSNDLEVRESIRSQLLEQIGENKLLRMIEEAILSWEQVNQMMELGMTFGSHTMTHLNLPNANPSYAKGEIVKSREFLERKLGKTIHHFSYPNSGPYEYFNEKIKTYVRETGYQSSTTSRQGYVNGKSDLFALERVRTVPDLAEVIHQMEWDRIFRKAGLN